MNDKRIIPCIFIKKGKAVAWFHDETVISEDVVSLAKFYNDNGADELILFDLSTSSTEHDEAIGLMKKVNRVIDIPMSAGGNIARLEDVKKILYTGASRAILNMSLKRMPMILEEACARFGKERLSVSLKDFDTLFKQQKIINECSSEIVFMQSLDFASISDTTELPCIIVTKTSKPERLTTMLLNKSIRGVTGKYVSNLSTNLIEFKDFCETQGIDMVSLSCEANFEDFKLNADGLLPVIVQHYKTGEVLMMAYMNEQAFKDTLHTGKMHYYSRSRNSQWLKGETSGHYQHVHSMTIDCDSDTLLAKVDQIGVACHTGNPTCFYTQIAGGNKKEKNSLQIFEDVYNTIVDRKENPKEGSYTNYLFDKGIDKILKKLGEEACEIIIAAKNPDKEEVKYEISDFLYHAMVLMVERGLTWEDIIEELADR